LENQSFTEADIVGVTADITSKLEQEGISLSFSWPKETFPQVIFCEIKIVRYI
jgi:hypothetical protein